jgi:hypothetical protein
MRPDTRRLSVGIERSQKSDLTCWAVTRISPASVTLIGELLVAEAYWQGLSDLGLERELLVLGR